MHVARIDPSTDEVINIELADAEWVAAANAAHAANPSLPYFVEWWPIEEWPHIDPMTPDPNDPKVKRGTPQVGLKWLRDLPPQAKFEKPPVGGPN